ncbi:hypothetical protein [Paenibacillus sp. SI8]
MTEWLNPRFRTHRVVRSFERMDVEDPEVAPRFGVLKYRLDLREIAFLHG